MTQPQPDIKIYPAPTDEEMAIIVAVLAVLETETVPFELQPKSSRWSAAARRESMREPL